MKNYLSIIPVLLIAFSCSIIDKETPGEGIPKSNIKGTVVTLAECDLTKLDPSGVTITVSDSATGKFIGMAVSDQKGAYSLTGIAEGTYNLSFEKEEFGTYKIYHRKHLITKLDSISQVQLAKKKYGIGEIKSMVIIDYGENLTCGGYIERPEGCVTVSGIIYFDDEPTVNYNNYKFVSEIQALYTMRSIPLKDIYAKGFKSGQAIYYTGYIEQLNSLTYFDPNFGVRIRPNIDFDSKTEVFSYILP